MTQILLQASQGIFLDSDNICVTAKKGDMAPINGQFDGLEVAGGYVAMESGTFCVDESTLALVQRSWGLSSEQEFDEVVKKKDEEAKEGGEEKRGKEGAEEGCQGERGGGKEKGGEG